MHAAGCLSCTHAAGFIIHQSVRLAAQSLASPAGVKALSLGAAAMGRVIGADVAAALPTYVSSLFLLFFSTLCCWAATAAAMGHVVGADVAAAPTRVSSFWISAVVVGALVSWVGVCCCALTWSSS
jgi:hypothetical protein